MGNEQHIILLLILIFITCIRDSHLWCHKFSFNLKFLPSKLRLLQMWFSVDLFIYSNARTCRFSSAPCRVTTTTWTPVMRKSPRPPPTSVLNSAVSTLSSPPSRPDMTKNFLPRPRRWKKWGNLALKTSKEKLKRKWKADKPNWAMCMRRCFPFFSQTQVECQNPGIGGPSWTDPPQMQQPREDQVQAHCRTQGSHHWTRKRKQKDLFRNSINGHVNC